MDPQACYDALLDALHDKRHDDILEHAENLIHWASNGGFVPKQINMKWVRERRREAATMVYLASDKGR